METQRLETGCEVQSAKPAIYEVPRSGKKLDDSAIEEERAKLGK
ncbi:MAG TPA: hypothetical protein VIN60_07835 [Anaerolineales bacterium]